MAIQDRIAVARGDRPAHLVLRDANLVNVISGEIYRTDIVCHDAYVVALGAGYAAEQEIDLGGRYVCPGFIDAHVHIESSLSTPAQFTRAVLPHGVTTAITDPHEIANVLGLEGIRFMLEQAKYGLMSIYVMASSCVPATTMETSGARLTALDLETLRQSEWVLGLAEVMNYPGVVYGDTDMLDKIELFRGMIIDGHCPQLLGTGLNAYVTAGIQSEHECTTVEEAREKLRRGMTIMIREGTATRNLRPLLPLITEQNHHHLCFCTDDRVPASLLDDGSIDYMIRVAIAEGIDPVVAIRMGTLNAARYFGLKKLGAVAPGRYADMVVFSDLHDLRAEMVFRGSKRVAENGKMLQKAKRGRSFSLRSTMNVHSNSLDFTMSAQGDAVHVIEVIPDQIVTRHKQMTAKIENGSYVADIDRDMLKIAVLERHQASGRVGRGFITGFGLQRGALAGSVAHDHHNLIVIGADDASMRTAAEAVIKMGGGLAVVDGTQLLGQLPLPVAGLMSDAPIEKIRDIYDALTRSIKELGCTLSDPFMVMSFMGLEVIPSLKLTDVGLIDVEQFKPISVTVQPE